MRIVSSSVSLSSSSPSRRRSTSSSLTLLCFGFWFRFLTWLACVDGGWKGNEVKSGKSSAERANSLRPPICGQVQVHIPSPVSASVSVTLRGSVNHVRADGMECSSFFPILSSPYRMGLDFFARQCQPQATETDALLWCVKKEGICCGICSDTLASIGTRVGLTVAVFFATLVIAIDGCESPFVFLTTSLQALAYLLVVLWEGLGGKGISRFHSYYALVCSFGWMCPLAAASLTATHYGYGGTHQKRGRKLFAYRTDFGRSKSSTRSLAHPARTIASSYLGPPDASSIRPRRHGQSESRPLVGHSSYDSSPQLSPRTSPEIPIMQRGRPRRKNSAEYQESEPSRQTPASLLGLPLPPVSLNDGDVSERAVDKHKDFEIDPPLRRDTVDSEADPIRTDSHNSRASRDRLGLHGVREIATGSETRKSVDTVYSPEHIEQIVRKVNDGRWRRYGYPASVAVLWALWLVAFLLIRGTIPSFTLSQTNCQDPDGTSLLKYASITFLGFGPLVVLAFVFNYHTQWLPRQARRILDYNRSGSLFTRFLLPGIVSGLIFVIWQALLWEGYHLASQPDSSLLAATEQSTTFAAVLSLALTVRPVTDLVKALAKIRKRRIREGRRPEWSPTTQGQTPSVLPEPPQIDELPTFARLELPAIPVSRASSIRARHDSLGVDKDQRQRPSRASRRSPVAPNILSPSPSKFNSTPSSERSSLVGPSTPPPRKSSARRSWRERLSVSPCR